MLERLVVYHDVEIDVFADVEKFRHLPQQLLVLRGEADGHAET